MNKNKKITNEDKINYSEVHAAISNALSDGLSSLNDSKANTFEISTFPNPLKLSNLFFLK